MLLHTRTIAPLARAVKALAESARGGWASERMYGRRNLHPDKYSGLQGFLGASQDEGGADGWASESGTERSKWPIATKIEGMGPPLMNLSRKVKHGLRQVDRVLDLFEPGQLGIAFNGGKDSTAVMHLVREACEAHPTHKFTHVQPIWFQHTGSEFPEVEDFVRETTAQYFSYREGLKTATSEDVNRLWLIQSNTPDEFNEAMAQIAITTGIRALLISSRRTDPGCRDLSQMALLDLSPVFLSHTVVRMDVNEKDDSEQTREVRGLPLGLSPWTTTSNVNQPSILRFSPILEWTHRDVWDFILASEVPYCALYDRGYTTIGTVDDTVVNPCLLRSNTGGFCSAFAPHEGELLTLEKALGPEKASPLTVALGEMFARLGVAIFGPATFELRNKQALQAMMSESEYYPAWMLKDEQQETGSDTANISVESPFRSSDDECTAAILVIGEEWITGAKREVCSSFLCAKLRSAGVKVRQTLLIENDVDVIAFMIRRMHLVHKYLFVIGGIGAHYGDVAMPAVAKAFGTGVVLDPSLLKRVVSAAPPTGLTAYHLRLAYAPYASELVGAGPLKEVEGGQGWREMMREWPVVKKNNTYLFQSHLPTLKDRFLDCLSPLLNFSRFQKATLHLELGAPAASRVLFSVSDEYSPMVSVQTRGTCLSTGEDGVVVVLESKDEELLKEALNKVVGAFPKGVLGPVEWEA
mmetsp:Transcript_24132/g.57806  ORF Transcript_24132/g.57806 Transcript_24132/m.57806 type:complete len:697 (+) Transcript_24132:202-2292(+)|eukprot:CAMPEP_0169429460 /NCGR_PEP_ID=MMETSP1042-20121227/1877_1 /TAXON_ID=464988 /ORGANISM="Hemiselmis andersenii, Strain CCMP1180" /LENGTH=696 /DNA_ID=CAMNT_0009539709 /DNA_START=188 /DNA_END=2278 /DNA_ORIENTATION=-